MRGCLLAFFLLLMASATAHASQPIASIHYPPSDCSGGTSVLNAEGWAELSVEAGTYPKMLSEHALTSADNGSELPMVGEMPGSFAEMVPALTNGVNDNLAYGFFENTQSLDENSLFASVPERSGPDLQGYRIDGMTVQVIDVTTNLNGSGTLLLFSCDLNFVIHGAHLRSLGGTVSGLAGSGLQLGVSLNGGAISAFDPGGNGSFVVPGQIGDGDSYSISVVQQPSSPGQICSVSNGSGLINGSDIDNIAVTCGSSILSSDAPLLTFSVFALGEVSPAQQLTLQNTGGGTITLGSLALSGPGANDFSFFDDGCSSAALAPGGQCAVHVDYGPLAGPTSNAQLDIPSDGVGVDHVLLNGIVLEVFAGGFE